MRIKKNGLIVVLTCFMFVGQCLMFTGTGDVVLAEDDSKIIRERIKSLRAAAEKFAYAYAHRQYNVMYELVIPKYRNRVPLWEYKDCVDYPGVTDGYIEVEVTDVSVLPHSKFRYGKVMLKMIMVETEKNKTTGEVKKIEDEKWEFQDWVHLKGQWYRIEKLDSN